eukprot:403339151
MEEQTQILPVQQSSSLAPTQIDDSGWVSHLTNRRVISMRGKDVKAFLQGLITSDMNVFDQEGPQRAAIYATFMTPKGKIRMDCFIVRPLLANQNSGETEYWIDVEENDVSEFLSIVTKHRIRKDVKFLDVSDAIEVFSVSTPMGVDCPAGHIFQDLQSQAMQFESEEFPGHMETDVVCFADPRTAMNGVRILCGKGSFEWDESDITNYPDSKYYNFARMTNGILESTAEVKNQFPLHLNFDQLNSVSTTKGCYIGQELIQRSTHTGVIRKQTFPFIVIKDPSFNPEDFAPLKQFNPDFTSKLVDAEVQTEKKVTVGKVLANQFNAGIAMMNLPKLLQQTPETRYFIQDKPVMLWQPAWQKIRKIDTSEQDEAEQQKMQEEHNQQILDKMKEVDLKERSDNDKFDKQK